MSLSAFLAQNAIQVENTKAVVSDRFLDENGKPEQWEIRSISSSEDDELRKACARHVPIPGKRNQYMPETDYAAYMCKLAVACTVYPDLNSAELQSSYHVLGAENLLKAMLTAGEYSAYMETIQSVCGFDKVTFDDKVKTVKN